MTIYHKAGKVEGTIQKCVLCGKVLITGLEDGKGYEEGDTIGDIQEVEDKEKVERELGAHLLGMSKPNCMEVKSKMEET